MFVNKGCCFFFFFSSALPVIFRAGECVYSWGLCHPFFFFVQGAWSLLAGMAIRYACALSHCTLFYRLQEGHSERKEREVIQTH
ncbi:hypothetical protein V8C26DRAFT_413629, partial [Trichoderma gracile]